MKVAIVTESFGKNGRMRNGVASSVAILIQALIEKGWQVQVFTTDIENNEAGVTLLPAIHIPRCEYPIVAPWKISEAAQRIVGWQPDIIHTHYQDTAGLAALEAAQHLNIPLIGTIHTLHHHYVDARLPGIFQPLGHWAVSKIVPKVLKGAQEIIVPSQYVATVTCKQLGIDHFCQVIPTPHTPYPSMNTYDREAVREKWGISPGSFVIGYAGRIAAEKDLLLLLQAFKVITHRLPLSKLSLVIAGGGPQLSYLKKMAKNCHIPVVFTGELAHLKLMEAAGAFDLFALPSRSETQALVLREAMQFGTPCLARKAGGAYETLLEGRGYVVEDLSHESFVQGIINLLHNQRLLASMGLEGRRFVEAYTTTKYGFYIDHLYQNHISHSYQQVA